MPHEEEGEREADSRHSRGRPKDGRGRTIQPAGGKIDRKVDRAEDQAHGHDHGRLLRGERAGRPAGNDDGGDPRCAGDQLAQVLPPREDEDAQARQEDEREDQPRARGCAGVPEEVEREAERDRRQGDRRSPENHESRPTLRAASEAPRNSAQNPRHTTIAVPVFSGT